jgi:polar amino acid transport system substrate-binding protein
VQRVQPAATIVAVPNLDDCLVSIQQAQVDAVTTDDAVLAGMAIQDPNLEIVGPGSASLAGGTARSPPGD